MENIAAFLVGCFFVLFIWVNTWIYEQWMDGLLKRKLIIKTKYYGVNK